MGADFEHAVDTLRKRLNAKPVAIQIPIGQEDKFRGVVDLIEMKSIVWQDDTIGAEYITGEIPAELQKKAEAFHTRWSRPSPKMTTRCCTSSSKARPFPPRNCGRRCANRPSR
jgi:translation elongation factor EF-G